MTDNIQTWLEDMGLGKDAEVFAENVIDLAALPHLTVNDLKDMGLVLRPRRKSLAAIAGMEVTAGDPVAGATVSLPSALAYG